MDRLTALLAMDTLNIRATFEGRGAVDFARGSGHFAIAGLVEETVRGDVADPKCLTAGSTARSHACFCATRERWTALRAAWVASVARSLASKHGPGEGGGLKR